MSEEWDRQERRQERPEWVGELIQAVTQVQSYKKDSSSNRRNYWYSLFEIASRIILASMVALQCWVVLEVFEIRERVAIIESNRFTISDWHKENQAIRSEINSKADRKNVPPKWFWEDFSELKKDVKEIQKKRFPS